MFLEEMRRVRREKTMRLCFVSQWSLWRGAGQPSSDDDSFSW